MTPDDKKLKEEMDTDYPLIPMKDITDEARIMAVTWMECGDKNWIGQKHKLASDIMNYNRRHQLFTKQDLIDCYSAGVLRGIAEASGTEDKLMSPKDYFMKNFNIDIDTPTK